MKKLVAISIMAALLLTIAAVAMASETDWLLLFKAQTSGATLASGVSQCGVLTGATDGYDSTKDGTTTFLSGNAGLGIWRDDWTVSNPRLYGKDARAAFPTGAGATKTWDLVLFVGSGYTGSDLKLIWWNVATNSTQDMAATMSGNPATYSVEIVNDPTATYAAGTKIVVDPNAAATTSSSPLGSFSWGANAVGAMKMDGATAINSGIRVRFTASNAVVPEPSSMVALLSGLAGLGGFAIRRRK